MARQTRMSLAILAPLCLIAITITAIHFTRSAASAEATTWYVDASVAASGGGQSPETPFKTIQEAIDAASEGDTIIVAEATYLENIHFNGKNIVLRSTAPLDSAVVAGTIIDGNKAGPAVSFTGTENETCLLSGFTIRNGFVAQYGAGSELQTSGDRADLVFIDIGDANVNLMVSATWDAAAWVSPECTQLNNGAAASCRLKGNAGFCSATVHKGIRTIASAGPNPVIWSGSVNGREGIGTVYASVAYQDKGANPDANAYSEIAVVYMVSPAQ